MQLCIESNAKIILNMQLCRTEDLLSEASCVRCGLADWFLFVQTAAALFQTAKGARFTSPPHPTPFSVSGVDITPAL